MHPLHAPVPGAFPASIMPTALSAVLGLAISARCASSTSAAETCPPGLRCSMVIDKPECVTMFDDLSDAQQRLSLK
jgi:hypothetical protein